MGVKSPTRLKEEPDPAWVMDSTDILARTNHFIRVQSLPLHWAGRKLHGHADLIGGTDCEDTTYSQCVEASTGVIGQAGVLVST